MSKNFNICCPGYFSKDLHKYKKDKTGKQKYCYKNCPRQFTLNSNTKPKLNCPKCPIRGAGTFLHHDYEHYSRFKCNSKNSPKKIVTGFPVIRFLLKLSLIEQNILKYSHGMMTSPTT